jgi:hypothetical protein
MQISKVTNRTSREKEQNCDVHNGLNNAGLSLHTINNLSLYRRATNVSTQNAEYDPFEKKKKV